MLRHFADTVDLCLCVGTRTGQHLVATIGTVLCGSIGASWPKLALGQLMRRLVHTANIWWAERLVVSIEPYRIGHRPVLALHEAKAQAGDAFLGGGSQQGIGRNARVHPSSQPDRLHHQYNILAYQAKL